MVLIHTVSSIAWLENDVFFMIYTPNALVDDMGDNPAASYYIITRRKQAPFLIQKLPEICSPMGFSIKRSPAYQFIARLRDYKPHLKDVLIVASTVSTDVGLVTRSEQPLAVDDISKGLAGQFTTTEVSDDTKRASVPLKDSTDETSVIGLAADLSSGDSVIAPIPGEEIAESSTPLPSLLLLNNDGIISSWWFIYSEAIRQKVPYAGLAANGQTSQTFAQSQSASLSSSTVQQPAFGQSAFGSASPFGASTFGKPSGGATFGSPSTMGATAFGKPTAPSFGSPSALAGGSAPAFGKPSTPAPAFGTPSQPGATFGSPSTPGQPQFGRSGFGAGNTPFGQASTTGKSPFGLSVGAASGGGSSGGFSSFSGGGGFSSFAAAKPGESPFAKASGESAFAKPSGPSPFGTKSDGDTAFGSQKPAETKNPFGSGTGSFVLGSSFKTDGSAVDDGPKTDKPSSGTFSFGGAFDEMVSSPGIPSPPAESMDDTEDTPSSQTAKTEVKSIFDAPEKPAMQQTTSLFGKQATQPMKSPSPIETTKSSFSFFSNTSSSQSNTQFTTQNQVTSPLSAPSDKTATPKREQSLSTPTFPSIEPPLPPEPTSRDSYAPGDTSASSNVSKSSIEDAPLPPDFVTQTKPPKVDEAPLPPDFIPQKKPTSKFDDAPLPPDFLSKPKKTESPPVVAENAPLPPDPSLKAKTGPPEELPVPDGSDADSEEDNDESDFTDSGEEITHEETKIPSPKPSAESSFAGLSEKSSTGGFFSGISRPAQQPMPPPRQLFGEIPKQPLLPPPGPATQSNREPYRSPSPIRAASQKSMLTNKPRLEAGSALSQRKASLTQLAQRGGHPRNISDAARKDEALAHQAAQRRQEEEEALALSDDDEDEMLRADLARPIEPASSLDPFLPHQNYMGETAKPGIPGMIERLYRDINSMVDTLGINARSLDSFLLYQQPPESSSVEEWINILQSEQPANILDEKAFLQDISKLDEVVAALGRSLQEQRVQGVEEKLTKCRELLTKDIVTLRGQCASIRKTLDAHTDTGAILAAPLSAEHAALQHDLRKAFTEIQAKMADLEQGVSMLRAKIADIPRTDGGAKKSMKRPTVEAVASTIATMMSMAESKSSDIDVLEAQMRKLGVDISSTVPTSREGSPFTTPRKNVSRFPSTPGSRGSFDGSAYHTPESASRGVHFRTSVNGSARHSRLRSVEGVGAMVAQDESTRWRINNKRREQLIGNLKTAIEKKEIKVRSADDL